MHRLAECKQLSCRSYSSKLNLSDGISSECCKKKDTLYVLRCVQLQCNHSRCTVVGLPELMPCGSPGGDHSVNAGQRCWSLECDPRLKDLQTKRDHEQTRLPSDWVGESMRWRLVQAMAFKPPAPSMPAPFDLRGAQTLYFHRPAALRASSIRAQWR